jgi:hypothetical protein
MPFQSLIAEATRYARFTMKQSGFLVPMMMASTGFNTPTLAGIG